MTESSKDRDFRKRDFKKEYYGPIMVKGNIVEPLQEYFKRHVQFRLCETWEIDPYDTVNNFIEEMIANREDMLDEIDRLRADLKHNIEYLHKAENQRDQAKKNCKELEKERDEWKEDWKGQFQNANENLGVIKKLEKERDERFTVDELKKLQEIKKKEEGEFYREECDLFTEIDFEKELKKLRGGCDYCRGKDHIHEQGDSDKPELEECPKCNRKLRE